jgi:hypothetical protein
MYVCVSGRGSPRRNTGLYYHVIVCVCVCDSVCPGAHIQQYRIFQIYIQQISADPRQHSRSWFRAPSGLNTKILLAARPCMYLEMGSPLRREEGLVFLSRQHICWTVISHEYSSCFKDTIHASSLYYNEYYLRTLYTGHLLMQASVADYALTCFATPKWHLVVWNVVGLTTAKFKPLWVNCYWPSPPELFL